MFQIGAQVVRVSRMGERLHPDEPVEVRTVVKIGEMDLFRSDDHKKRGIRYATASGLYFKETKEPGLWQDFELVDRALTDLAIAVMASISLRNDINAALHQIRSAA